MDDMVRDGDRFALGWHCEKPMPQLLPLPHFGARVAAASNDPLILPSISCRFSCSRRGGGATAGGGAAGGGSGWQQAVAVFTSVRNGAFELFQGGSGSSLQ